MAIYRDLILDPPRVLGSPKTQGGRKFRAQTHGGWIKGEAMREAFSRAIIK